jgi:hypothetical protein
MLTLAEIVTRTAADLAATRAELAALLAAPVGTPAQEAATNARIAELKKAIGNR